MEPKLDKQFVEPLIKGLGELRSNKRCLYPGCPKEPIDSHVIAESVLEQIADKEEKVLTWQPHENNIVLNTIQGHEWDYIYKEPRRVGIGREATFPIFCGEHDNSIFAPLEDQGFDFQPQQVALLAYRALCYRTWNPHLEKKLEFFLSNQDPETVLQQQRLFSFKTTREARQKLENILATRDYSQIKWITRKLPIKPCLACTDATIPYHGEEDTKNVMSGSSFHKAEDFVTFSFFPEKKLNATICVITWFKGSQQGLKFIEDLRLEQLSEDDIQNRLMITALKMSLVYISPDWWDTLSAEQQGGISKLRLSNVRSFPDV